MAQPRADGHRGPRERRLPPALRWPRHRFWANGIDAGFPKAPSGVLCGGPNDAVNDEYIRGAGLKRGALASQKCYVDSGEAWSVNEVKLNWNAPLAWVTSYLEDAAPGINDIARHSWGDANLDGNVTVADATAVLQSIANKDKYELEPQGKINADIVDNGDGVTPKDALAIQMLDAKLISKTDLPIASENMSALSAK